MNHLFTYFCNANMRLIERLESIEEENISEEDIEQEIRGAAGIMDKKENICLQLLDSKESPHRYD